MNKFLKFATVSAVVLAGSVANAATITYTEGVREQIVDSVRVTGGSNGVYDVSDTLPGFDLGTVDADNSVNLHGRVTWKSDAYNFVSNNVFDLSWIFDGYELASGFVAASGFTESSIGRDGAGAADFTLINYDTGDSYSTGILGTGITSGNSVVFAGLSAGSYGLLISGASRAGSEYDLQLAAVPLPASALFLLTGLAGLGFARRRRTMAV